MTVDNQGLDTLDLPDEVEILIRETCTRCTGTGKKTDDRAACEKCGGTGKITRSMPINEMAKLVGKVISSLRERE